MNQHPPQKDNTLKIVLIVVGAVMALGLLVVLAFGLAGFFLFQRASGEATTAFTEVELHQMVQSSQVYKLQNGRWPKTLDELANPSAGSPVIEKVPHDSWGKPMRIVKDGDHIRVESAGPDGVFDTGDDLTASSKP